MISALATTSGAYNVYDAIKSDDLYKNGKINVGLPEDTQDKVEQLVLSRSIPDIKDIRLIPETPGADEPVTVMVEIFTSPRIGRDETDEAEIVYSADGGKTWGHSPMSKILGSDTVWSGVIPGQPAGATIMYGFRIVNFSGNMYMDVLCSMADNPLETEGYVEGDCPDNAAPGACDALLPRNCMFPLILNEPDPDDDTQAAPPDLDMLDSRIGYDENNLYLDITVKGEISPGRLSPMQIHIYAAGGINPDRPGGSKGLEQLINQGAVMIYVPIDTAAPCSIYYLTGSKLRRDDYNSTCATKKNHLLFTFKRAITEPNPSKTLEFMLFDFLQTSAFPLNMRLMDFSHFTRFKFDTRSFTIK